MNIISLQQIIVQSGSSSITVEYALLLYEFQNSDFFSSLVDKLNNSVDSKFARYQVKVKLKVDKLKPVFLNIII